MNKPLISVIVPIYMIERYVGLCIESIINQTYNNLEIILVDDGSKDRCPAICDLYAKKDKRIKVIHKRNGGLVSARKSGLKQAAGSYISYVDGDDWIEPGFIETLYTTAVTTGADAVCAGQTRDLFRQSAFFSNSLPPGLYEEGKLQFLWENMMSYGHFYRPGITTYVWNKLFRKEVLLSPQLNVDDRITIGEDAAVTYPALLNSKKVAVIENVAYHYRQREDSMLKQSAGYVDEAKKLKYLCDYMMQWADTAPADLDIRKQVTDYILSIAIIRSGGRLPHVDFSFFGKGYYDKDVVIFSAGTFGQQLVNRFKEAGHCNVKAWLDDDYWEYRRCCMDVDSVESIVNLTYDYVLIATVDGVVADSIKKRLLDLGVANNKILIITVPEDKNDLLQNFLDVESIQEEERIISHA